MRIVTYTDTGRPRPAIEVEGWRLQSFEEFAFAGDRYSASRSGLVVVGQLLESTKWPAGEVQMTTEEARRLMVELMVYFGAEHKTPEKGA